MQDAGRVQVPWTEAHRLGVRKWIFRIARKRMIPAVEFGELLKQEGQQILDCPDTIDRDTDGYIDVSECVRWLTKKIIYYRM